MPTFPRKISGPKITAPSSLGPSMTTNKVTDTTKKDVKSKASSYSK